MTERSPTLDAVGTGAGQSGGRPLPGGIVTFLFTDIENSTPLFRRLGAGFHALLDAHSDHIRQAVMRHDGVEVRTEGDSFFVAFEDAAAAVRAATDAQLALVRHPWPEGAELRVRMGLHTGPAEPHDGDYISITVHEAARVATAGHGGQILVSKAAATAVRSHGDIQLDELGTYHLRDFREPEALYQVSHPELPRDHPPIRSLVVLNHNLPGTGGRLVGRDGELDETVAAITATTTSAVVITGPGGVGKTRLAVEVGHRAAQHFADGVWFVGLAALVEGDDLAAHVLTTLGLRQTATDSVDTLCRNLVTKRALLVLDNCEQVAMGAGQLAGRLLTACPHLMVLMTSRAPVALGTAARTVVRLGPLPTPHEDDPAELIPSSSSIQLFLDRVAAAGIAGTFPEAASYDLMARIVRELDGLPLAIELAAARVPALGLAGVAAGIGDRSKGISGAEGTGGSDPDTARLRSVVAWSYDLLETTAQEALRALALIPGPFSLRTAVAMAGPSLAGFVSLVDRSLVQSDVSKADATYQILEVVRDFAHASTPADAQQQHAGRLVAWAVERCANVPVGIVRAEQAQVAAELDADTAAIDVALEFAEADSDAGPLAGLVVALEQYWLRRGRLRDADRWTNTAIARRHELDDRGRAALLASAAVVARVAGDTTSALAYAAEAAVAAASDDGLMAKAEYAAAAALFVLGDFAGAATRLESATRLAIAADDRVTLTNALVTHGAIAYRQARFADAIRIMEEAIERLSQLGNRSRQAFALNSLANIHLDSGQPERARQLFAEALAMCTALGDLQGVAGALHDTALMHIRALEHDAARALLDQALLAARRCGDMSIVALALNSLGVVASRQGDIEGAIAYAKETLALVDATRTPMAAVHPLANLVHYHLDLGDVDGAQAWLAQLLTVAKAHDTPLVRVIAAQAEGRTALFADDRATATTRYEELAAAGPELTPPRSLIVTFTLAFLALAAGDEERAAELASRLAQHSVDGSASADRVRALVARSMVARRSGQLDVAAALMTEAAAVDPADDSSTLLWVGETARWLAARGERERAGDLLSAVARAATGGTPPAPYERELFSEDDVLAALARDPTLALPEAAEIARHRLAALAPVTA